MCIFEGLAQYLKNCPQSVNVSYHYSSQKTYIFFLSVVLLKTTYIISLCQYLIICKIHLYPPSDFYNCVMCSYIS